jgi:hypothetical protein
MTTIVKGKPMTAAVLGLAALSAVSVIAFSPAAEAAPAPSAVAGNATPFDMDKVGTRNGSASLASVGYSAYVGYLGAGVTGRYCFHWSHANQGAVAVSAGARTFNVIVTTVSTDLENRLNYGWTYCATIRNASSVGSDVDLYARAAL